jgi:hypothetical protein
MLTHVTGRSEIKILMRKQSERYDSGKKRTSNIKEDENGG